MEKMSRILPSRFMQITVAIMALLDVSMMGVADLIGRLKEAEEAFEEPPSTMQHEGRPYLIEEEWIARQKKHEVANGHIGGLSSGGGSSSGSSHGRGSHGHGHGCGVKNGSNGGPCKAMGAINWAIGLTNVGQSPRKSRQM
jgi:hypothetical protein